MTTVQLKSRLISRLEKTHNQALLEAVESMINAFETTEGNVYMLSDEEQKDVNIGLDDMRNGKVVSSEDAAIRTREWLRGK